MKNIKQAKQIAEVIQEALSNCDGKCEDCAFFIIHTNGTEICIRLTGVRDAIENKLNRTLEQFQDQEKELKKSAYGYYKKIPYIDANEAVNRPVEPVDAQQPIRQMQPLGVYWDVMQNNVPNDVPIEPIEPIPRPNHNGEVAQEVRQAQRQNDAQRLIEQLRGMNNVLRGNGNEPNQR